MSLYVFLFIKWKAINHPRSSYIRLIIKIFRHHHSTTICHACATHRKIHFQFNN